MRLLRGASALALLLAALPGCEVRTLVTGRPGYLCETDADCDPGMRCRVADGDSEPRCWPEPVAADGGLDTVGDPVVAPDLEPVTCNIEPTCADLVTVATCEGPSAPGGLMRCADGTRCDQGACIDAGEVTASVSLMWSGQSGTPFANLVGNFWYDAEPVPFEDIEEEDCRTYGVVVGEVGPALFDAGALTVRGLSGGDRVIGFNPDSSSMPPHTYLVDFDAATAEQFPFGQTVEVQGAGGGLVGPFVADVTVPPLRTITAPASGSTIVHSTSWTVTWTGATQQGSVLVSVVVGAIGVTCRVPDTGSYLVRNTGNLVGHLFLAVHDFHRTPLLADGLDSGVLDANVIDSINAELVEPQP